MNGWSAPFSAADAEELAPHVCAADCEEIAEAGYADPLACLLDGIQQGPCFGAWDGNTIIGVYGYTRGGLIWSFWRDLTRAQARAVFRFTRPMVAEMVAKSGHPFLYNVVLRSHTKAVAWLKRCGCFEVRDVGDFAFIPFATKDEFAPCVIQS